MGPCPYVGAAKPPAVSLDLTQEGDALKGTLRLNFAALTIPGCPAIEKVVEVQEMAPAASSLAFSGPGDHAWTLGKRGNEMLGTVAWKGAGPGAEGLRLSGEVKLAHAGARGGASAKKGGAMGAVGGILIANVVGIGAFAAANKLGKGDTAEAPQVNCSPRQCFFIGVGEPCQCNTPTTAGGTCGTTTSGVTYLGVCNVDGGLPCQAGLSCNSGFCEDRFGHCPF